MMSFSQPTIKRIEKNFKENVSTIVNNILRIKLFIYFFNTN